LAKRAHPPFSHLLCHLVSIELAAGVASHALGPSVAALVTWLTSDLPMVFSGLTILEPSRFWYFCTWYLPVFWWECLKANIDMAYRVLHPHLPILSGSRPSTDRTPERFSVDGAGQLHFADARHHFRRRQPGKGDPLRALHACIARRGRKEATLIVQRFARILRKVFE